MSNGRRGTWFKAPAFLELASGSPPSRGKRQSVSLFGITQITSKLLVTVTVSYLTLNLAISPAQHRFRHLDTCLCCNNLATLSQTSPHGATKANQNGMCTLEQNKGSRHWAITTISISKPVFTLKISPSV
jgi:hypothetical protein